MPFQRPTLSQERAQVAQDIASSLPGADALLRFSNLAILGDVQAGLSILHYGYLDWISLQAVPFTSQGEFLEGWAALKKVFRDPATQATGTATFTGTNGTVLPANTLLVRGDGVEYTVMADGIVAGGTVTVTAQAVADPTGQTGAFGNCASGTVLNLGTAIAGLTSTGAAPTAFTGGADLESDASLLNRMLGAYQATPVIGTSSNYETWAREVSGVTRAWCIANGMGSGTVVVYFMMDASEAAHGGFPQGSNGVATAETRDVAATGDQLLVANHIYTVQTNTALVYAVAPTQENETFTISGLAGSSTGTRNAIAAAIADVFLRNGSPKQTTINLADINAAIAAVPLTTGFVITVVNGGAPGNITPALGALPILGTVTYV